MKEFEKKAMEDLLKKRTTFRKSVVPVGKANQFENIGFLKGIK